MPQLDRGGSPRRARWDAWTFALLGVALAAGVLYIVVGAQLVEISQNDGAYYYGVARHMARTGRFEEPIVWHFLAVPEQLTHAPFDYWGCLTSLLLVPSLAVFGATPHVAFVTMSVLSAMVVLALWYLVCIALPLRHRVTQLLAIVLFALSPAMVDYRHQPESIVVAQLFLLLALIAFGHRRWGWALSCGFGIMLARGDGLVLYALLVVAVLVAAAGDMGGRRAARWLLVPAGWMALYVGWSLAAFGAPVPPAPSLVPFLGDYLEVFDYGVSRVRSPDRLLQRFGWEYLAERATVVWMTVQLVLFTPAAPWWDLLALLGVLGWRRWGASEWLVWMLCFGGFLLLVWTAGPGFYVFRGPHTFTPLVILAGALAVDGLLGWLERLQVGARWPLLPTVVGVGVGAFFVLRLSLPAPYPRAMRRDVGPPLAALEPVLRGEPVASNMPWYVMAYTTSPTVSVAFNGEAAIAGVLERFGVRWLVLGGGGFDAVGGESKAVVEGLLAGTRSTVGGFTLERVGGRGRPAVFRVVPPGEQEKTRIMEWRVLPPTVAPPTPASHRDRRPRTRPRETPPARAG